MKNILTIDIDTDREHTVLIKKPDHIKKPETDEEAKNMVISDMACMCEGLVTLIHLAHQNKMKDSVQSLKDCIKHLEDGFIDSQYKTVNLASPNKDNEQEEEINS